MDTKTLYWLAGLLEGEGYFSIHKSGVAIVGIEMKDEDVIEKVASIINSNVRKRVRSEGDRDLVTYVCSVYGDKAIQWIETLYCLMGKRRQERMLECIVAWRTGIRIGMSKHVKRTHCRKGHALTEENTFVYEVSGKRGCKMCKMVRDTQLEARKILKEEYKKVNKPLSGIEAQFNTECKYGHAYSLENTYIRPDGTRECRTCRRAKRVRV